MGTVLGEGLEAGLPRRMTIKGRGQPHHTVDTDRGRGGTLLLRTPLQAVVGLQGLSPYLPICHSSPWPRFSDWPAPGHPGCRDSLGLNQASFFPLFHPCHLLSPSASLPLPCSKRSPRPGMPSHHLSESLSTVPLKTMAGMNLRAAVRKPRFWSQHNH